MLFQRDSAEHKGYAKALGHSIDMKERDSHTEALGSILYKDNFNRRIKELRQTRERQVLME